jgi:RNA polymerase sigma-B factor
VSIVGESGELSPSDAELLAVTRPHPRDSPEREAACHELVTRYHQLVAACVQQYHASPETAEDMTQVGYVGLLKAINNYDPSFGNGLAAYARPYVSGEIKRYFRDKRWPVHVERSVQELRLAVRAAAGNLTQNLQRAPAEAEVAQFLDVSHESLASARLADMFLQMASLDAPLSEGSGSGPGELADLLGAPDARLDQVVDLDAVATHWPQLTAVQQQVLLLRFYGDMKQADIAAQLGVTQVQVSRLQSRALTRLRSAILDDTA